MSGADKTKIDAIVYDEPAITLNDGGGVITLGGGSNSFAKVQKNQGWVMITATWKFGTSPSLGSGQFRFTLPHSAHADYRTGAVPGDAVGWGSVYDDSTNTRYPVIVVLRGSGVAGISQVSGPNVSSGSPITWANNDTVFVHIMYQAA
jgi:hypothetical protein